MHDEGDTDEVTYRRNLFAVSDDSHILIWKYMLLRRLVELLPPDPVQLAAWAILLRGAIQRHTAHENRCDVEQPSGHLGHLCETLCREEGCFLATAALPGP